MHFHDALSAGRSLAGLALTLLLCAGGPAADAARDDSLSAPSPVTDQRLVNAIRDDANWLCHSLYFPTDKRVGKRAVNFEPKTVETFQPKARVY